MTMPRALCLCAVVIFLCAGSPASAGWYWDCEDLFNPCRILHKVYKLHNRIAYLEANPYADESYKGPVIVAAHAKILRLHSRHLFPVRPLWSTPCCYTRRPIYIR